MNAILDLEAVRGALVVLKRHVDAGHDLDPDTQAAILNWALSLIDMQQAALELTKTELEEHE